MYDQNVDFSLIRTLSLVHYQPHSLIAMGVHGNGQVRFNREDSPKILWPSNHAIKCIGTSIDQLLIKLSEEALPKPSLILNQGFEISLTTLTEIEGQLEPRDSRHRAWVGSRPSKESAIMPQPKFNQAKD